MKKCCLALLLSTAAPLLFAAQARAFDPNEGAEPIVPPHSGSFAPAPRPLNQPYAWQADRTNLSRDVVPERYRIAPPAAPSVPTQTIVTPRPMPAPVNGITYAPATMAAAPMPMPATPMPVYDPALNSTVSAPANAARYAPVENLSPTPTPEFATPADTYIAATSPAATEVKPYSPPVYDEPQYASNQPQRANRYSFGIEGFYDNYQEPVTFPDLESQSYYVGITGGIEHHYGDLSRSHPYIAGDLRVSYGSEDYSSSSGQIDNIPQWEFEGRFLAGQSFRYASGRSLKLYSGLGTRYYRDESKGEVTNTGSLGYDRRILQFYAPIGLTYEFPAYGYVFTPNFEADVLLYGSVSSRLGNIPGITNALNEQSIGSGYGLRAEFAISKLDARGRGWQLSPFVRYWEVGNSRDDLVFNQGNVGFAREPKNERYQVGAKLKYLF